MKLPEHFPIKTAGVLVIILVIVLSGVFIAINGIPFTSKDNSQKLIYGDFVGGLTTAGVMESENLWAKNGMSVTVNNYTAPNDLANALQLNEVDITTGTPETYAKLNSQNNINFKIIGEEYVLLQEVIIRNDSNFHKLTDLQGKKLGVLTSSGTFSYFSSLVSQLYNISDVNSYFQIVNDPPAVLIDALESKQLDAIILWQPDVAKAETIYPNLVPLITFQDMYEQVSGNTNIPPMVLWFASNNALQTKAAELKKFMDLQKTVVGYFTTNASLIKDSFKKYFNYNDNEANNLFSQVKDKFRPYTLNSTVIDSIRNNWEIFYDHGKSQYITKDPALLPDSCFVIL